jgi:hypothetical protein
MVPKIKIKWVVGRQEMRDERQRERRSFFLLS